MEEVECVISRCDFSVLSRGALVADSDSRAQGPGLRGFPFSLLSSQVPLAPPQWPLPAWDLSPSIQSHLELAGWSS